MFLHVMVMAFVMVMASCGLMVPILLNLLGLGGDRGWDWPHAALFAAMVGSTDAVAAVAAARAAAAPEHLGVLLEGEALFNDATSIVLFKIFQRSIAKAASGQASGSFFVVVWGILQQTAYLAGVGAAVGVVAGVATRLLMRAAHRRSHRDAAPQLALTLAASYAAYHAAEVVHASGVTAVVVLGLYGASTSAFGTSAGVLAGGKFRGFWDGLAFAMNAIVFFFSGAQSVNFLWWAACCVAGVERGGGGAGAAAGGRRGGLICLSPHHFRQPPATTAPFPLNNPT